MSQGLYRSRPPTNWLRPEFQKFYVPCQIELSSLAVPDTCPQNRQIILFQNNVINTHTLTQQEGLSNREGRILEFSSRFLRLKHGTESSRLRRGFAAASSSKRLCLESLLAPQAETSRSPDDGGTTTQGQEEVQCDQHKDTREKSLARLHSTFPKKLPYSGGDGGQNH